MLPLGNGLRFSGVLYNDGLALRVLLAPTIPQTIDGLSLAALGFRPGSLTRLVSGPALSVGVLPGLVPLARLVFRLTLIAARLIFPAAI